MIQVGNKFYDQALLQAMGARAGEAVGLHDRSKLSFAVCLSDPAEFLALLLAIRDAGASVLPIHPSTRALLRTGWQSTSAATGW